MSEIERKYDYVVEYLGAYQSKIKLANQIGLLNEAKMFELFAVKLCRLWFQQPFHNLNQETANYAYVDLVSEDRKIFVQVSTVQDIPAKIKKTLENIRDSRSTDIQNITNVIFFMLDNESVSKVKDLSGDECIGKISFTKDKNLITTRQILNRASEDKDFLDELYSFLYETDQAFRNCSKALKEQVEDSRHCGIEQIDYLINGEYSIDRSELIQKIRNDNFQFISIQGPAGSGKSALCRMLLEDEELVLYCRAEHLLEVPDINSIWNLNLRDVFTYLNGKKIVLFIDALEFISDCRTKTDMLQKVYTIASSYKNVYIVTSCRSSENSAFIQMESQQDIHLYPIGEITGSELEPLKAKYPVLAAMSQIKAYREFLQSPLYINLIISNQIEMGDLSDEIKLREYIWRNIICLGGKCTRYKLKFNEVVEVIEKIVLDRAINFSSGVCDDDIDSDILRALESENIITHSDDKVRLKYDTFEDICFEHRIDKLYDACKGNYSQFYKKIEEFGRCIYRRYQIWVSNKLLGANNRAIFLSRLVFNDEVDANWKKQTEIGIIKSRHCDEFFEEYADQISQSDLLDEFIKTTNLFGFEARIFNINKTEPHLLLTPSGNGRPCLIKMIYSKELYKNPHLKLDIIKLCDDYTKNPTHNDAVCNATCDILEYWAEDLESELEGFEGYANPMQGLDLLLPGIYRLAAYSKGWIISLWNQKIELYKNGSERTSRRASEIIEWTIKNAYYRLFIDMPQEICNLARVFWTIDCADNRIQSCLYNYDDLLDRKERCYGLSKEGRDCNLTDTRTIDRVFFANLYFYALPTALEWTISFMNQACSKYVESCPSEVREVQIYFPKTKDTRKYFANVNWWCAGVIEYCVPVLLSDMIYLLKGKVVDIIKQLLHSGKKEEAKSFANGIKKILYEKSNNVILLTIIEEIGFAFYSELPGYCIELSSSLELISFDWKRYVHISSDPTRDLLKKQIQTIIGIPDMSSRYALSDSQKVTLQQYFTYWQTTTEEYVKSDCYEILDFLYAQIPNDEGHAQNLLTIQSMDLRRAKITDLGNGLIQLEPVISGYAEKIAKAHDSTTNPSPDQKFCQDALQLFSNQDTNENNLDKIENYIDLMIRSMDQSPMPFRYHDLLIKAFSTALQSDLLPIQKRNDYCSIWVNGLRQIFSNGSFAAKIDSVDTLFSQLKYDLSRDTAYSIKRLMLDSILGIGSNGLINKLSGKVQRFLLNNPELANCICATIIELAKDEMRHQKFNANYLQAYYPQKAITFQPNLQPKLIGVDRMIQNDKREGYCSKKEEIIEKYLFEATNINLDEIDVNQCDLPTLCLVVNCGIPLSNPFFRNLVHRIILSIIDAMHTAKKHKFYEWIDCYKLHQFVLLYSNQVIAQNIAPFEAIDLLFDGIDFTKFSDEAVELYCDIFCSYASAYFDAYNNPQERKQYTDCITYIGKKISDITCEHIKKKLYKPLFFCVSPRIVGNWDKCKTKYSYQDKCFLNAQLSKYGKYSLKDALITVYQFHIAELLPEILLSVRNCLSYNAENMENFQEIMRDEDITLIVNKIILTAFVNYSDEIKSSEELTKTYEDILEILIQLNHEKAAVLLDEFRVH